MPATMLHRTVLIFSAGLFCACLANLLYHLPVQPVSADWLPWIWTATDSLTATGILMVFALYLRARRS
jgi:hypothetical protein